MATTKTTTHGDLAALIAAAVADELKKHGHSVPGSAPEPMRTKPARRAKSRDNVGELIKRSTSRYWWVRYVDERGRRRFISTRTEDRPTAEQLLADLLSAKRKGVPSTAAVGAVTLKDALDDVIADMRFKGRRSVAQVEDVIGRVILPYFDGGARKLTSVTPRDLRSYAEARLAVKKAPATVNYELSCIRRAFRLALGEGRIMTMPRVPMLTADNVRKGFVSAEQFESIAGHLPAYAEPPLRFAFITGWRSRSEVLTLQWQHVDFETREVRLDPKHSKNRTGRTFPFTQSLERLLLAQKAIHEAYKAKGKVVPWVFPYLDLGMTRTKVRERGTHSRDGERQEDLGKVWATACKRAGLPGLVIHDLRRSAVRRFEQAGISRSVSMSFSGHKTMSVFSRYAISDSAAQREGATKLDALDALDQARSPKPPTGTVATFASKQQVQSA